MRPQVAIFAFAVAEKTVLVERDCLELYRCFNMVFVNCLELGATLADIFGIPDPGQNILDMLAIGLCGKFAAGKWKFGYFNAMHITAGLDAVRLKIDVVEKIYAEFHC